MKANDVQIGCYYTYDAKRITRMTRVLDGGMPIRRDFRHPVNTSFPWPLARVCPRHLSTINPDHIISYYLLRCAVLFPQVKSQAVPINHFPTNPSTSLNLKGGLPAGTSCILRTLGSQNARFRSPTARRRGFSTCANTRCGPFSLLLPFFSQE